MGKLASEITFHVRHEVFPDRVLQILQALELGDVFDSVTQADRQLKRMRDLGLIQEAGSDPTLSLKGSHIVQIVVKRNNLWGDLGHFLHYTLWDRTTPSANGFSWFYRSFCEHLWQEGVFRISDKATLKALCADFNNRIEEDEVFQPYLAGNPSLSTDSVSGIQHWLEVLNPPVIENDTFTRRTFCPPELLLLAIGWAFRDEPDPIGVPLLLSRDRRDAICRLCLLDPNAFDRAVDWMLPRFPSVIESGDKAGFYGRSIRLRKMPSLEDIAS